MEEIKINRKEFRNAFIDAVMDVSKQAPDSELMIVTGLVGSMIADKLEGKLFEEKEYYNEKN